MAEDRIRIGVVGFGIVGSGVAKILLEDATEIEKKTGLKLELAAIVDLDTTTKRPVDLPDGILSDNIDAILKDDSIQIGVELIGGTTAAKDIQIAMLKAGKHVVTANKALLAKHGPELYAVARENDCCIAFEASCAGGIPIVSALRTGLAANRITSIYGILNGTCNYILSSMTATNEYFPDALKQAQEKGYAEADPTLDINGADSAHKLAILAGLAFGYEISLDNISIEGIEKVSIEDILCGLEMGYIMKLLAIAEKDQDGLISLRVHPSFIAIDNPLAQVDGSFNAVSVFGHAVGQAMFYGRGAGMMPTASAIMADIIEVATGNSQRIFNCYQSQVQSGNKLPLNEADNNISRYYIRLRVKDLPGVFATYGKILGDNQISIAGALQHETAGPDGMVPVVITTHPTKQKNMSKALCELAKHDLISSEPVCIRIVDIPEDQD